MFLIPLVLEVQVTLVIQLNQTLDHLLLALRLWSIQMYPATLQVVQIHHLLVCHLQAGLVGAVCGVRSLGLPLSLDNLRTDALALLVPELLQAWLPLIGSALLLNGLHRFLPASRP